MHRAWKTLELLSLVALASTLVAALPGRAHAQSTCNATVAIAYVGGPTFAKPGDTVRIQLSLGAQQIQGGTKVNINRLRFDLDCSADGPLGIGCVDDGAVVSFAGGITNTCGVTFATAAGPTPNQVVFTPNTPIMIFANTANACVLEFDVQVDAATSNDSSPLAIEQVGGYNAATNDARCDNNLSSGGSQSASINLCPSCDDANACTEDVCNQDDGTCTNTDTVTATCNDNDSCTNDRCIPESGLCANTPVEIDCNDNDSCTDDACVGTAPEPTCSHTPVDLDCNDNDSCTTDRCDGTGAEPVCVNTGPVLDCNDGDSCTADRCDGTGAEPVCVNTGPVLDCNDSDSCTDDACVGTGAEPTCSHTPVNLDCNDNDSCTDDACVGTGAEATCSHTAVDLNCNDNDSCTTDACVGTGAEPTCSHTPVGLDCNDNDSCTNDACVGTAETPACSHTPVELNCDDNDKCTTDACVGTGATPTCGHTPIDLNCDDNSKCTEESCNPATGTCRTTSTKDCDDNNKCTADSCVAETGACSNVPNVDCNDNNKCTADRCLPASGTCEHSEKTCGDPVCERCEPDTGECVFDRNLDSLCAPIGCRVTSGGHTTLNPELANGKKATFGGQVGAPCGCSGCFDTINGTDKDDHVQGNWVHQRHNGGGMFKATEFNSLVCGCLDLAGGPGVLNGDLCNPGDRDAGPEPRKAPANAICFTGVGDFRGKPAAFRVEIQDRGEPGQGKNAGTLDDVYRIRIWAPKNGETAKGLATAACCINTTPNIRTPDVDEGDVVSKAINGGNLQIHPGTPHTKAGECPVPAVSCPK